jgi:hypothetical protein
MGVQNVRLIDGKKFMWDGRVYENIQDAQKFVQEYEGNNFEVRMLQEEGKYLLYTRRVVKEIVLEGPPPI